MKTIYNLLIRLVSFFLKIIAIFSKKMNQFVEGRKDVFQILKSKLHPNDRVIWFHCASLGEFEQAVPVIEAVRKLFSSHKILLSFFSPSGFENKKNTKLADVVVYLPLDLTENANQFIRLAHPEMVFFVKYEFWPNYLFELNRHHIPTYLISGVFRRNQLFFKNYGGFMRKALDSFSWFFLQNTESLDLLNSLGYQNAVVSGDTRFDRVTEQLQRDNRLPVVADFINNRLCIVCGSTWPEDESLLMEFINKAPDNCCFIIAPHKIEKEKINSLLEKIRRKSILHSEIWENSPISNFDVLIIDCIGLLTRLYSYADIAFVGGAAGKTGLHNILEPATFGVPVVIGKNYQNFPEAESLKNEGGLFSVATTEACTEILTKLAADSNFRKTAGAAAKSFIAKNTGATDMIIDYLKTPITKD